MDKPESVHIEALRKLTPNLSKAEDIMVKKTGSFCTEVDLELEAGSATAFGLYKSKAIAICRVFQTKGSKYPAHAHKQHEVAGVISGKFTIHFPNGGGSRTLEEYEHIYLPPNTPHWCEFHEDTWTWVITMPAAPEFPDATNGRVNETD